MSPVKRIICLANSKKEGERCIAGIDIDTGKWVRPVCDSLYPRDGRVPKYICLVNGREPELLDILEIPLADTGNNFDFESENLSVLKGQWKVVGKSKIQDVIQYCDDGAILHNSSKLVYPKYLQSLPLDKRKTLQLINAVSLSIKSRRTSRGGIQWLGTIVSASGKRLIDIPITDSAFVRKIESGYQPDGNYLITMSLGMPYKPDNWEGEETPCWKLIAGVIELSGTQLTNYKSELESETKLITETNKLQLSLYKVDTLNASSPIISISENQNFMALSNDRDLIVVKCWDTKEYLKYHRNVDKVINPPIYSKTLEIDSDISVFFSPDGQLFGTLDLTKGEVKCWSIASSRLLYKFTNSSLASIREVYEGNEDEGIPEDVLISAYTIFFSSEKNIIVCSYFGIKAWKEGKLLYSIPQYCVTSNNISIDIEEVIAFNNVRDIFVFTDNKSQTTSLINLKNGQLMTSFSNNSSNISLVTLSHNGSLLVLVENNGILKLYDLSSNKFLKSLSILEGYKIFDVKVSSDLNHIAVISAKAGNGWQLASSRVRAMFDELFDRKKEVEEVELIRGEYGVKILNIQTGEVFAFIDYSDKCPINHPNFLAEHISQLLFSNDGKLLFVQRQDDWRKPCWVEVFHLFYQWKTK